MRFSGWKLREVSLGSQNLKPWYLKHHSSILFGIPFDVTMPLNVLRCDISCSSFLLRVHAVHILWFDSIKRAVDASVAWVVVPNVEDASANIVMEITVKVERAMERRLPFTVKINPSCDTTGCCVVQNSLKEIRCRAEGHRSVKH
jgi:hypothetical protein